MQLLWRLASAAVTCAGVLALGLAAVVAGMLLVVRPWDARVSRYAARTKRALVRAAPLRVSRGYLNTAQGTRTRLTEPLATLVPAAHAAPHAGL